MEKTVLVVEDDPAVCLLIEYTLRALGHRIVTVNGGHAALAAATEHRPDMVILDVSLPDLTGFQVCQRLRADPTIGRPTIAFVTAHGTPEDRARGTAVGGDAYFVKPFSPGALRAFVAEQLGKAPDAPGAS